MGSCLGCNCFICLNKAISSNSFGEKFKHKKFISKLLKNNYNNDKAKTDNSELSLVKLKKYINKSFDPSIKSEEINPAHNTTTHLIKKLDVTEYLTDSISSRTSTTRSSRSAIQKSIQKEDSQINSNEFEASNIIGNTDLSCLTVLNPESSNMPNKDEQIFEYEDDYENSWNNDKLIDENFNLNFDINQININLIGKCHYSSSSSNSCNGSLSSNSTSVSRYSSGRSRMSINFNNKKSDISNLIPNDDKNQTTSSQIVKSIMKNINKNDANKNSSLSKQTEEKNHSNKSNHHNNHHGDNKYLYFVQKIKQVNVDGFEWDLM